MKDNKKINYLDFMPMIAEGIVAWEEEERIVVRISHKGMLHWISNRLYRTPKESNISLDQYGSYVWKQMNGKNSIYDIAMAMKQEFGAEAEPLYERLVSFISLLEQNKFIKNNCIAVKKNT